jgi:hypothetical protein
LHVSSPLNDSRRRAAALKEMEWCRLVLPGFAEGMENWDIQLKAPTNATPATGQEARPTGEAAAVIAASAASVAASPSLLPPSPPPSSPSPVALAHSQLAHHRRSMLAHLNVEAARFAEAQAEAMQLQR